MATYYVDYVNGLDANNGLGPDASDSTNKPWKTIAKLLGASGMASGDTAYLSPAGPFREVVTVAMTSAVAETKVLGDPANAQGFKTSGGVRVAPGEVVWTGFTTNDTTAPPDTDLLDLAGRDYLTFENVTMICGGANCINGGTNTSTNITFRNCSLLSNIFDNGQYMIYVTGAAGVALHWLLDSCVIFHNMALPCIGIEPATDVSGTHWDIDFVVQNCLVITVWSGSDNIQFAPSGANSGKPGGLIVKNSTIFGGSVGIAATNANTSTTYPILVYNCIVFSGTGLSANTLGQLVENYNLVHASTTRTNVTQGGNSPNNNTYSPRLEFGQSWQSGATPRPFLAPSRGSPFLGFGNNGTYTVSTDAMGIPRPSGGASANKGIGYLERGNTFAQETSTVRTGSNAISITGPGTQDFQLPVDATSTTVTCYVRWDATYAGTKPQMKVLNCEEAGVTAASTTATGSSGAWEQLSLNFTPTRAGIVTIRLQSNDTNGGGKMFADDFDVS